MYEELIEKLGELGFVESDEKTSKVAKYDQYTGELLPEKIMPVELEFNNCNITLQEDSFYIKRHSINVFYNKGTRVTGYMTVSNPSNYSIKDIYEMAKQMLDKVQEGNKDV